MSWIVVPRWGEFQHYSDRDPVWIKLYTDLQTRDEWCRLTLAERGLLVSIWMAYARSNGVLSTQLLPSFVTASTRHQQLEALKHAGFIEIVASKPSRTRAGAHAKRREEKNPQTPADAGASNHRLSKKELRRYTGCTLKRGSHGSSWVRDPLGMDRPPPDWPHPEPTIEEVTKALAAGASPRERSTT